MTVDVVDDLRKFVPTILASASEVAAHSHEGGASVPWKAGEELAQVINFASPERVRGQHSRLWAWDESADLTPLLEALWNPWALQNPRAFYGKKVLGKCNRLAQGGLVVFVQRDRKGAFFAPERQLEDLAILAREQCSFDTAHKSALASASRSGRDS